jgi:hypothetical protein
MNSSLHKYQKTITKDIDKFLQVYNCTKKQTKMVASLLLKTLELEFL